MKFFFIEGKFGFGLVFIGYCAIFVIFKGVSGFYWIRSRESYFICEEF